MPESSRSSMPSDIGQAQALVEYVENPQNLVRVGLLTWMHYFQAKIFLLQSHLPPSQKIRYTHLNTHPRALNAIELERYIAREIDYMGERLAYVEKKLQQLWQTAGLAERQAQIMREGLEIPFTYRELTEMWERGA